MVRSTINRLILIVLLAFCPLTSVLVSGESEQCADILTLFARGSGQNQGDIITEGFLKNSGVSSDEQQSIQFFSSIKDRLSDNLTREFISLHDFDGKYNTYGYQAVDVDVGFTQKPHHRTDVYNRYYESVADGAEELAWFLEDRVSSCPFQQIILGGYSQGAHVVGDAMFKLKPNLRTRIAYVALFGDPKFNPRTSSIPTITGSWVRGNASSMQTGTLLARKDYFPDEVLYKTSWCDLDDPVCANYSITNKPFNSVYDLFIDKTHQNAYQEKWIPMAANEIAKAVKDRTPSLAGNIITSTFVNKNDKSYQLDLALVIDGSGSMIDQLKTIKKDLGGFTASLFGAYWDTRIGIVAFNDHIAWEPAYFSKVVTPFTHSRDEVKAGIQSLTAKYGYDVDEAQYSGLMTAMNELSWRQGAQKKILVITDAPAKNPDPGPEHWTKEQVVRRALELDPVSISFAKLTAYNKSWQSMLDMNAEYLTGATNGVITSTKYYNKTDFIFSALTTMDMQPVAAINGASAGFVGELVSVSGGASYDPDSSIVSYNWDCNDDGVWDVIGSTQPTFECVYSEPYSGFVVLEVKSADSGTAKATLTIDVTNRSQSTLAAPAAPHAQAIRDDNNVLITWDNAYEDGVVLRILSGNDEVLGYADSGDNSFTLTDAPTTAFNLVLEAGNSTSWSAPTLVEVGEFVPPPDPTPTPSPDPPTEPIPVPEITVVPTPEITPTPTPVSDQSENIYDLYKDFPAPTPTPSTIPTPTTANEVIFNNQPTPITNVAGISDSSPQPTPTTQDNSRGAAIASPNQDTKLFWLGLLILLVGVWGITHRPRKKKK